MPLCPSASSVSRADHRARRRPGSSRPQHGRAPNRPETHRSTWRPWAELLKRAFAIDLTCTGLRLGELLALRWADVDLDASRIVVRRAVARGVIGTPKNGRSREVPLSEQALGALKTQPRRGDLVFAGADGGLMSKDATKAPLRNALKASGLRHIGWHTLRHSFASHLVMRGAPIKAVQELLGIARSR